MTTEPLPTPSHVQTAGEDVLRHHAQAYAEARAAIGPAVDFAKDCLVDPADIWRICKEAGLDEGDVLALTERVGPSWCVCGGLRVEHPRGGKSTVAGSGCGKFEAAK